MFQLSTVDARRLRSLDSASVWRLVPNIFNDFSGFTPRRGSERFFFFFFLAFWWRRWLRAGCEAQEWGWMGCQTQAPLWDTRVISIQDEWCRRRLIMPFEKWWQRKISLEIWGSSPSRNESSAPALCQSTWTFIWGLLYIQYENHSFPAKPKALREIHFLSSGNTFWWMRQLCC